jgi:hypothetical protein
VVPYPLGRKVGSLSDTDEPKPYDGGRGRCSGQLGASYVAVAGL